MIHYHGTPISTNETLVALSGKHFFVSFFRPDSIGVVAEISSTFAIDNGAFSAYNKGVSIDWDKYKDFVYKWMKPNMNFHIIPDVIGGTWKENMRLIEGWDVRRSAPVWHMSEPLEMAKELSYNYEYLCIGGNVGKHSNIGSLDWWQRINEFMEVVCDDGVPRCKIHGLRMLDNALRSIPFYSADSTNLARHLSRPDMSRTAAALCLSQWIESSQASTRWEGLPKQQNLLGMEF